MTKAQNSTVLLLLSHDDSSGDQTAPPLDSLQGQAALRLRFSTTRHAKIRGGKRTGRDQTSTTRTAMSGASLAPLAPFPGSSWRGHLGDGEWDELLITYTTLCRARAAEDPGTLARDESVVAFLTSFAEETAADGVVILGAHKIPLLHAVHRLLTRMLGARPGSAVPRALLTFAFTANLARVFPQRLAAPVIAQLLDEDGTAGRLEGSLSGVKKELIQHLDAGIKGDLKLAERRLLRLNPLLHVSPHAAALFLAGSDFFDALVAGFRVMNPPLRKAIVATLYLCLVGLAEARPPRWAMLSDQLYAMRLAAEAHKAGPLNERESLVPELVTSTPILKVLLRRAEAGDAANETFKKRISTLQGWKNGPMVKPKRLAKRKIDKGKRVEGLADGPGAEMHVHKMSKITQVQDLFPDLGSGFVARCLDEYGEDVEQVIANLIEDSLPTHLASADRSEQLSPNAPTHTDLAPRSTPEEPQLPARKNVYDDDDFDRLAMDVSKVSFGKRPERTADQLLQDRASAPGKAAILSALAAFDGDDDERDDTYDAADVGGTVDSANQEADAAADVHEERLFRAFKDNPDVFCRDAVARRAPDRIKLRQETGMTDEEVEGWLLMLYRDQPRMRRLEDKYAFKGEQRNIERTAWRAGESGTDTDGGSARGGGHRGRGRGRGRGAGGGGARGGRVDGPTGEKETEAARRKKEANKGSRANHNRREGRARKMARGGFSG